MKTQLPLIKTGDAGADISDCGLYRYRLWRQWGPGSSVLWIMLNPSTADGTLDDPTIRRCRSFSKAWGCDRLEVVNLFALRATNPDDLLYNSDPIGPKNDEVLIRAALNDHAGLIIAAWGVNGDIHGRAKEVVDLLSIVPLHSLGHTKFGHPRHPLYVAGDTQLKTFL